MELFKDGSLVRVKNARSSDRYQGRIVERNYSCYKVKFGTGEIWNYGHNDLEVVEEASPDEPVPFPSPVRITQKREIVPGVYGRFYIDTRADGDILISPTDTGGKVADVTRAYHLTSSQLREAAHLFNQLAEALEQNAKEGAV